MKENIASLDPLAAEVGTYIPVVTGENQLVILDTRNGTVWNYNGNGSWKLETHGPRLGSHQ